MVIIALRVVFPAPLCLFLLFLLVTFVIKLYRQWSANDQLENTVTHWVIDDSYYKAATRTYCDVLVFLELLSRNLEAITTRARVMVDSFLVVPGHILDFYLVIIGTHFLVC